MGECAQDPGLKTYGLPRNGADLLDDSFREEWCNIRQHLVAHARGQAGEQQPDADMDCGFALTNFSENVDKDAAQRLPQGQLPQRL